MIVFSAEASGSMGRIVHRQAVQEPSAGARRLKSLLEALNGAGPQAIGRARAEAGAELVSFLQEQAPQAAAASKIASIIWGAPLSVEAAVSGASWAPMAAQLMKEDPRRALLTLAIAPALGLQPSSNLLAESKGALKKMGLSESVWKELGALPGADFDEVLAAFKRASEGKPGFAASFMDLDFAGLPGQSRSTPADPFKAVGQQSARDQESGRLELERVAAGVSLLSQAARMARMPLTSAVGFCSKNAPSSPAWEAQKLELIAPEELGGTDLARIFEVFHDFGGAEARAGKDFLSFCAQKLLGPLAEGPEGEMERAERLALGARAPKILALAMAEAARRPIREALRELADLTDWFRRSEPGLWQQLPEKMTWASLRRREQAWHKELQAAKDAEFQTPWARELEEPVSAQGRLARELSSGAELFEEGKAMGHCVSTYAQDCRDRECRIYSITDEEGARIATLEAKFKTLPDGRERAWAAQLRGPYNQLVTDEGALRASEEVIKALNAALEARFERGQAAEIEGERAAREQAAPSDASGVLGALAARRQAREPERPEQGPRPGREPR